MQKFFYALLLATATTAPSAWAVLDYCQDIALPSGHRFSDEKFPLCNFEEGLSVIVFNDRYGFADDTGKVRIAPTFDEAYNFQNGLALIKQNGKYGYLDPNGKVIVKPSYEDAWGFNDGLAKVSVKGKIGFIDKTGKLTIAPQFDKSQDWFEAGVVAVYQTTANKWGMIDKTGKLITPYAYDFIDEPSNGRILVGKKMSGGEDGMRFGYLDLAGNVAILPTFKSAQKFKAGLAEVITDTDEKQHINILGKATEPKPIFEY